jgi:hypothetical protein
MNSSLSKKEKIEKMLDILHGVETPIEYLEIKKKRYPEFFYKKEIDDLSIENEPNIYVSNWDRESINISATKSNMRIADKVGLFSDKNENSFAWDEEFELFSGEIPF